MNVIVLIKQVPDLVEDLEVDASGRALDAELVKLTLNEFDDHALEEGLLLKEETGGQLTVIARDGDGVDKLLFTALAKGADRALKVTGAGGDAGNRGLAALFKEVLAGEPHDLILTGVQAADDRDGQLAPMVAAALDLPSIEVVTSVRASGAAVTVEKEYSGGYEAEFEVDLPAVLGIQAARQSPRYAPVSKVRQMQQSSTLETRAVTGGGGGGLTVVEMRPPETGAGAQMLAGVDELLSVLESKGVI